MSSETVLARPFGELNLASDIGEDGFRQSLKCANLKPDNNNVISNCPNQALKTCGRCYLVNVSFLPSASASTQCIANQLFCFSIAHANASFSTRPSTSLTASMNLLRPLGFRIGLKNTVSLAFRAALRLSPLARGDSCGAMYLHMTSSIYQNAKAWTTRKT